MVAALALALGGCGDEKDERGQTLTRETLTPGEGQPGEGQTLPRERAGTDPAVRRARCPAGLANCRSATGRVTFVEAVDPDGDGDAHYVLAGGDITLPGISVIDVKPSLRPRKLPRKGDWVSAAGPVYRGSYGQRQIEAVVVHHER